MWWYKRSVKKKYFRALQREQPVRCAISSNPSPQRQFEWGVEGVEEVLDRNKIPHDERKVYQILEHLINKWPGGLTSYNTQYVMYNAKDHGMLDKQFNPVANAPFVHEENARRQHIVRTGGVAALNIYLKD